MSKVMIQPSWPDRTETGATDDAPALPSRPVRDSENHEQESAQKLEVDAGPASITSAPPSTIANPVTKDKNAKHRFGLPAGFVSRVSRFGRTILFQDNVYRLPNGAEFIPQPPVGTLGSPNHQYALLTSDQYETGRRGSIYVRTDGRIFDYACDKPTMERDLFDTGFTIHDLERTGRYAPVLKARRLGSTRRQKAKKRGRKSRTRTRT
jgi:hypothetical protein